MHRRRMRSYKLRLSPQGFGCFLDCHHRIARLLGEMIPYGMTLYIAMSVLADAPVASWVDVDDERLSCTLRGDRTYYVGYTFEIAELTVAITRAREAEGRQPLPVGHLYVLALQSLRLIDDAELRAAGERAAAL